MHYIVFLLIVCMVFVWFRLPARTKCNAFYVVAEVEHTMGCAEKKNNHNNNSQLNSLFSVGYDYQFLPPT